MRKFLIGLGVVLALVLSLGAYALADGGIQISMNSTPVSGTVTFDLSRQPQVQLSANVPVTWTRSSSSYCTIDEKAAMTLLKTGSFKVTAKAADGSKATVKVKVVRGVTSIGITGKSEMSAGQSARFKAAVLPSNATKKSVTWSSSDPSVAGVNKYGNVTAKAVSEVKTAVIYATAADGSGVVGQYTVTVKPVASSVTLYLDGQVVNGQTLSIDLAAVTTMRLTAVVQPSGASQEIKWSTSSSSRAKVSGGLVNALKKGEITLTAAATDGSRVKATCRISIGVISKNISISGPNSVLTGKKITLKSTVLPANTANKKVVWSSSNPSVASVSTRGVVTGGAVTAKSSATIYATAQDGGCVGSWTVSVTPKPLAVNVTRDGAAISNVVFLDSAAKGSKISMKSSVYPADASQSVSWSSSNKRVVTVDANGTLTCVGEGKAIVTAKANDGTKISRSFYVACGNFSELPYYIEIDKTNQVVRVYERGDGSYTHLVRRMICSTGKKENKFADGLYRLNGSRAHWLRAQDPVYYMQYSTRISGSYLFHAVPTLGAYADRVKVDYYNKLGTRASGGCIRLLCADAKWIYENVPKDCFVLNMHSVRDPAEYGAVSAPSIKGSWDPTDDNPANPYYDSTYSSVVK